MVIDGVLFCYCHHLFTNNAQSPQQRISTALCRQSALSTLKLSLLNTNRGTLIDSTASKLSSLKKVLNSLIEIPSYAHDSKLKFEFTIGCIIQDFSDVPPR